MSSIAKKLMMTAAGGGFTAIEDVFSCFLYTGNGTTQTITNGIDLAGEGGLVWIKSRSAVRSNQLSDTERGINKSLVSNDTAAEVTQTNPSFYGLSSFNSDGFSVGAYNGFNNSGDTIASWTFRKTPRFFDVVTYTGDGGTQDINHNLGVIPGCVIVKRTDATGNWAVLHRISDTAYAGGVSSEPFALNLTNATARQDTPATVGLTDTTFKAEQIGNNTTGGPTNTSGATYVAYLFAHDPLGPSGDGSDGLIDCGSYTSDATGKATIDIGWEPQWVLYKGSSAATHWSIADSMRGFVADTASTRGKYLNANQSAAELSNAPVGITSTGFKYDSAPNINFIYIAIRRGPMRAPESGTEVFAPKVVVGDRTGNHVISGLGFAPDFVFGNGRGGDVVTYDKLRGASRSINTNDTSAETNDTSLAAFLNDGYLIGSNGGRFYDDGTGSITWSFRRAPEFFDVVAYTGNGVTGRAVPHNLGVVPEMIIVKNRTTLNRAWQVYHEYLGITGRLELDKDIDGTAVVTHWTNAPTDTEFTVRNLGVLNGSGDNYIAYLFATLAGISKVGSYTGNGSSQTINCGFTTGARFILIKRTDSTGDWYVWDTARGIVAGNDPFLELNTSDAEVTSDDSIDPDSSGFIVNQTGTTNVNVSSASYIFYAVS